MYEYVLAYPNHYQASCQELSGFYVRHNLPATYQWTLYSFSNLKVSSEAQEAMDVRTW